MKKMPCSVNTSRCKTERSRGGGFLEPYSDVVQVEGKKEIEKEKDGGKDEIEIRKLQEAEKNKCMIQHLILYIVCVCI